MTKEMQQEKLDSVLEGFFAKWDTADIPKNGVLQKTKKDDLITMIEGFRVNPPSRGPRPKIGDLVKVLLTDKELDLFTKDEFAAVIKEAFNSRGLRCEIKNLEWYPSAKGFTAVPRRKA